MTSILLMAGAPGDAGGVGSFLPLILIMVVFYFFMIYPQMKKSKQQKKFREALAEGDKVVTVGGIHGKIEKMDETSFIINSEGTRLRIDKTSISMEASQALNAPKKDDKK
ncbi:MAG: preprotein translocase subunit YajC [Bacteroidia bacterium]|nr:preprotein translocase subunit YajC [Bacteroidia bacterium]MCC7534389.1 preprotein translocase subunit YajC [Bacteroidia bacterium]MCZ2140865.1 preprotein translocase subunit YajC [Bacteroidia bacterium]